MRCRGLLALLGLLLLCEGQEQSGSGESCDNFTDLDLAHCFLGTSLYVRLLLYTRSNLDCGRELRHRRLSEQPLFNASRPTTFVIHGYRPTGAPPIWIQHIVHLLAQQDDMNIVVVDWNKGAANLNYFTAVTYTRQAAHNLTGFILTMQEEGASLSSVHLVGVSLGAHLAGYVGANPPACLGLQAWTRRDRCSPAPQRRRGWTPRTPCLWTCCRLRSEPVERHAAEAGTDQSLLQHHGSAALQEEQLQGGHGDLEPVPPLGGGLHPAARGQDVHRGPDRPVSETPHRTEAFGGGQLIRWWADLHLSPPPGSKLLRFEQYTSTRLLAQFDEDLPQIQKISMRISTGNVIGPRYKIRLLRVRFTPLERPDRPLMCRFDIIMEENVEVAFRPLPCDSHL